MCRIPLQSEGQTVLRCVYCFEPCRGVVTMEQPCMRSYSLLLIKTCHRRGIHAMGGMAAQIPVKNNPQANETALQKVIIKIPTSLIPARRNVRPARLTIA